MVQVSYPGVYIQEVPSGVNIITGVSTSIAAFFGRTSSGLVNKPTRCQSWGDFEREFVGSPEGSDLAAYVRQFFDNGGSDCYVVRIAHGAENADLVISNLNGIQVLVATAKYPGSVGNLIRIGINYNTKNPEDTFNMIISLTDGTNETVVEEFTNLSINSTSTNYAPDVITQSSEYIELALESTLVPDTSAPNSGYSESRRPLNITSSQNLIDELNGIIDNEHRRFEISVNDGPYVQVNLKENDGVDAILTADDPADLQGTLDNIANEIATKINAAIDAVIPPGTPKVTCSLPSGNIQVLRIISNDNSLASVRIRKDANEDVSSRLMLGIDQGGIEFTRYSALRPAPNANVFDLRNVNALQIWFRMQL
ncbi:MAG: hypothetical protein HRO68_06105 [Nitrosopumilus sp.]|nr:hypothetical protein [Nitrosopumilus sp.]